ncbi:MAG: hypothetical protein RLZZ283_249 [Candidatus Parcubacteria bacterium]|jgi:hypothetical protein
MFAKEQKQKWHQAQADEHFKKAAELQIKSNSIREEALKIEDPDERGARLGVAVEFQRMAEDRLKRGQQALIMVAQYS